MKRFSDMAIYLKGVQKNEVLNTLNIYKKVMNEIKLLGEVKMSQGVISCIPLGEDLEKM